MKALLDGINFIATRVKYFRKLDEFHADNTSIFYLDETWSNVDDDKRRIWLVEYSRGCLKTSDRTGEIKEMIRPWTVPF